MVPFNDPLYPMINPEMLKNNIVVFDDYTSLEKNLFNHTISLIQDLLERSRKMDITLIIISHLTTDYQKTRKIIFECETFFISPSSNPVSAKKFLVNYCDLDKCEAEYIVDEVDKPFMWLSYHKSLPRYFMTKEKIRLI